MADGNEELEIYNNVFFIPQGADVDLFLWTGRGNEWTRNAKIVNNIFYSEGTGKNSVGLKRQAVDDGTFIREPGVGKSTGIVFERNVLYGTFEGIPEDWRKMITDPKLTAPGTGASGFDSLSGYHLRSGSPCIGAGIPVTNNGGRDFWGNPLPARKNPSIGAHEAK
jgi:hypothetical protein